LNPEEKRQEADVPVEQGSCPVSESEHSKSIPRLQPVFCPFNRHPDPTHLLVRGKNIFRGNIVTEAIVSKSMPIKLKKMKINNTNYY
jgi:hypothetical protein